MKKNTLKSHVKNRMEEKREKLRASLNSIAEKYAHEFMKRYLNHKELELAEAAFETYKQRLERALGGMGARNVTNFLYHTNHLNNPDGKLKSTLKGSFEDAARLGPDVHRITQFKDFMQPEVYTFLIMQAEKIHEEYGLKMKQYSQLEVELQGVITAAPNAKEAMATLTELGIDLSDLKEDPKLPAVVKVTQPVCLFNGDC